MNQPPLKPDALVAAYAVYAGMTAEQWRTRPPTGWREGIMEDVNLAVSAYLAAALPEVTSVDPRELNRRGWTCGCEPGNYDTCDECQSACNELAGFLSRPEVKP